jgi:hypothetical protein
MAVPIRHRHRTDSPKQNRILAYFEIPYCAAGNALPALRVMVGHDTCFRLTARRWAAPMLRAADK